jgi:hypothetical protein
LLLILFLILLFLLDERADMCFSAQASFAASAVLIPAGAYCVRNALRKKPAYLPFAAIPIFFGIQQFSEGWVWLGLDQDNLALVQPASLVFLFFAMPFWPLWISLSAAVAERSRPRKLLLAAITILSLAWFWLGFLPVLQDPDLRLETRVVHHSIQYELHDLPIFAIASEGFRRFFYLCNIALPMILCREKISTALGILLAIAALITQAIFWYAFVSVWCFFAACLALYECWFFHKLPFAQNLSPGDRAQHYSKEQGALAS